ncbi:hypothetical protein E0L36_23185 [Streptomyces sp. AJS327]|uniref:hypothetical protein n=1 Tax=Streptomyces sp. AJS327 TaxID=2545265 RepID=UPI0015DFF2FD|nr:hypothetical protein [Streptomyces sp. AJS327]MBA0053664.1 hypothetical protein [Streptomyces sp. AJS327]
MTEAVDAAKDLESHLATGGAFLSIAVSGMQLPPDEYAVADVWCTSSLYYAAPIEYPVGRAGFFENHPDLGHRWVDNPRLDRKRRDAAEREAAARWRDDVPTRAVLTGSALHLLRQDAAGWSGYGHDQLLSCVTDHQALGTSLGYRGCLPVRLTGAAVPWLAVALNHLRTSHLVRTTSQEN